MTRYRANTELTIFAILVGLIIFIAVVIGCQRSHIDRLERQVDSVQADANYYQKMAVDCVTRDVRIHVPEPEYRP